MNTIIKKVAYAAAITVVFTTNVKGQPPTNFYWNGTATDNVNLDIGRTGKVAIGPNIGTLPAALTYQFQVETSSFNDGIMIDQTGGGSNEASLFLQQGGTNYWSLNHNSAGDFHLFESATSLSPLFIKNTTGNVGINNPNPTAKLDVYDDGTTATRAGVFTMQSTIGGNYRGIDVISDASAGGGGNTSRGISVNSSAFGNGSDSYGIEVNSSVNLSGGTGGTSSGIIASGSGSDLAYGVQGIASGANNQNVGVYGSATGTSNWAGYFNGDVYISGTYGPSDRQLKTDIKPMTNALDNLMKLKPSTYNFKIKDFPAMNLPQGNQMGLIAQDVEEVFPNIVREVKEHKLPAKKGEEALTVPAHKAINYEGLIPVLIAAMQEQEQKITNLEIQLAASQQKQTGIEELNTSANGFYMENIPNPYTTETTIKYTLPQNVNSAYLAVYDLSGKQLASYAVNKTETSLVISAKDLSAGMYLYSIIADGKVLGTKRMVVSGK